MDLTTIAVAFFVAVFYVGIGVIKNWSANRKEFVFDWPKAGMTFGAVLLYAIAAGIGVLPPDTLDTLEAFLGLGGAGVVIKSLFDTGINLVPAKETNAVPGKKKS